MILLSSVIKVVAAVVGACWLGIWMCATQNRQKLTEQVQVYDAPALRPRRKWVTPGQEEAGQGQGQAPPPVSGAGASELTPEQRWVGGRQGSPMQCRRKGRDRSPPFVTATGAIKTDCASCH